MVNRLPRQDRARILHHLVEGNSMRATTRLLGVGINTVARLVRDAGEASQSYHDAHVCDLTVRNIECDEVHGFVYAHQNRLATAIAPPTGAGDVYTWTALATESKLIITWRVGRRERDDAVPFMLDLRSRLAVRPQVTTDGHRPYGEAIHRAFGDEVDYARLLKLYREDPQRCAAGRPRWRRAWLPSGIRSSGWWSWSSSGRHRQGNAAPTGNGRRPEPVARHDFLLQRGMRYYNRDSPLTTGQTLRRHSGEQLRPRRPHTAKSKESPLWQIRSSAHQ